MTREDYQETAATCREAAQAFAAVNGGDGRPEVMISAAEHFEDLAKAAAGVMPDLEEPPWSDLAAKADYAEATPEAVVIKDLFRMQCAHRLRSVARVIRCRGPELGAVLAEDFAGKAEEFCRRELIEAHRAWVLANSSGPQE